MKAISLQFNPFFEYGEVTLPTSKSLSNRALVIRELCAQPFNIHSLSNSDDSQNLRDCLNNLEGTIDIGSAGTNMRFLISLLSTQSGTFKLTGDSRIQQRPISQLVASLQSIGAEISYLNEEGFPPIQITGKNLTGGEIQIDGSISSQFISSLLMIAPHLKNGLKIEITSPLVSKPYVDMTIGLMKYFGVECKMDNDIIDVHHQIYQPKDYEVEPDWSCAAFWYGLIATSKIGSRIFLKKLSSNSLQGDKKSVEYFKLLGVTSTQNKEGMLIEKTNEASNNLSFNLVNEPDLFPVLAYCIASLKLSVSFTGLQTLHLKESNRIEATFTELQKTGAVCQLGENHFTISHYNNRPNKLVFDTYQDHRLAMAATMFLCCSESITIQDKEVVSKSYPGFWETLELVGIANIY